MSVAAFFIAAAFFAVVAAVVLLDAAAVLAGRCQEWDATDEHHKTSGALERASRCAAPPAGSPTRGGRGHP